jgi:hypothetical protein
MSRSNAISLVSESIQKLLKEKMEDPKPDVTILAPDEPSSSHQRVNLFLYKVQENPMMRNLDWQVSRNDPTRIVPPPLSLNLFYLLTVYAKSDQQAGDSTAHAILGDAMRVLYENATVPDRYLMGDLKQNSEQIKIIQVPVDMDEMSRVWSTFGRPFRPSLMYEVSVVQIAMKVQEHPVAKRVTEIKVGEVKTSFIPPTIEQIRPLRGVAGTQITIYGTHLAGWKAVVRLAGKQILETNKLDADTIDVKLSEDLTPGLYELQVDIEQFCRRTFFFEVQAQ